MRLRVVFYNNQKHDILRDMVKKEKSTFEPTKLSLALAAFASVSLLCLAALTSGL